RCHNNIRNRDIDKIKVSELVQEILRGHWVMNCESLIIGVTGIVLNGQHTLIALVLATQQWEEVGKDSQIREVWPNKPTIDKLIVFGASEEDKVVNTMDTAKPRSLGDVIFRSDYFADAKRADK